MKIKHTNLASGSYRDNKRKSKTSLFSKLFQVKTVCINSLEWRGLVKLVWLINKQVQYRFKRKPSECSTYWVYGRYCTVIAFVGKEQQTKFWIQKLLNRIILLFSSTIITLYHFKFIYKKSSSIYVVMYLSIIKKDTTSKDYNSEIVICNNNDIRCK